METTEGKLHIFLACADEELLKQVCVLLRRQDSAELVGCSTDGIRAWELIRQQKPDLVVLDGDLPQADGFALAAWMREAQMHECGIILLSAFVGAQTYSECRLLHVDALVRKPLCAAALYERIRLVENCLRQGSKFERRLAQLLIELGMREDTSGYRCALHSVCLYRETGGASITKVVYHEAARRLHIESGHVERNMRYAVGRVWDKCDKAVLARYFGEARVQEKEPISNREFCAALTEYLRREENLF